MCQLTVKGRVWKLGDKVNTDVITPGKYLSLPMNELKRHVLEPLVPEFHKKVKPGDVIVAGKNFGCGSSREQAPAALKALGVSAIVAEGFARIFFRNAISLGLAVVVCEGIWEATEEGDLIEINLETGRLTNLRLGQTFATKPLSKQMIEMLKAGGAISLLKKRFEK